MASVKLDAEVNVLMRFIPRHSPVGCVDGKAAGTSEEEFER